MRVLVVEDEPYMAEAIRDGLRLEAIAADVAGDGDTALELLAVNAYDVAVLDRDIPGPSGDEVARHVVASGVGSASRGSSPRSRAWGTGSMRSPPRDAGRGTRAGPERPAPAHPQLRRLPDG